MNPEFALRLMSDAESDRVERKSVLKNDKDRVAQAICAFANDLPRHNQPGYILIGVDDKTGNATGLPITDHLLLELSDIRDNGNILPQPFMLVEKVVLPDANEIAVVTVSPSDLPPIRYKGQIWIRVGPRRAIANEQEERVLSERRVANARTFDMSVCRGSNVNELDVAIFQSTYLPNAIAPDILEANHRSIEEKLASLRFYDLESNSPTNAGILLFGKDILRWLPGAYIQFIRFSGEEEEVIDEKQLTGDLLTVLRELLGLITVYNTNRPIFINPFQQEMQQAYPVLALRELLINAVLHRDYNINSPIRFYWYDNHIEIQSPGGLYGNATSQNFPRQNSYRNPVMAEALKTLGFVNRFGKGVERALNALKNNNQNAIFSFDHGYVFVSIQSYPLAVEE